MRCAGEVKNTKNDDWTRCPDDRLQGSDFCARTDHRHRKDNHPLKNVGISAEEVVTGATAIGRALRGDKPSDPVNPSHYRQGGLEAIDVIEAFGLGFCAGNTLKYILRYRFKGRPLVDLRKARWYLDREISQLEQSDESESD